MDKTGRNGLRIGDILEPDFNKRYGFLVEKHKQILATHTAFHYDAAKLADDEKKWMECIEFIRTLRCTDTEYLLNDALKQGKKILAEGAQGSLLDIDFGSYPFVTSSSTTCAGACIGLGLAPAAIGNVVGVFKAYCTRVGSGPFPTEQLNEFGDKMCTIGKEFGSTTGRRRRCGWLDIPTLKRAIILNGVTCLNMMKTDVLNDFDEVEVCTHYVIGDRQTDQVPYDLGSASISPVYRKFKGWGKINDSSSYDKLPEELKQYIGFIEESTGVPVKLVSIGPERNQTIIR
jgi:adenylosuccinate synthase